MNWKNILFVILCFIFPPLLILVVLWILEKSIIFVLLKNYSVDKDSLSSSVMVVILVRVITLALLAAGSEFFALEYLDAFETDFFILLRYLFLLGITWIIVGFVYVRLLSDLLTVSSNKEIHKIAFTSSLIGIILMLAVIVLVSSGCIMSGGC